MARGQIAKEAVIQKIKELFGQDFIAEQDKKLYVWENDGGERVQIAIALTCPKTFIETFDAHGDYDFTGESAPVITTAAPVTAEITEKEKETLQDLLKKFGLD